jgi:hypothetical protein
MLLLDDDDELPVVPTQGEVEHRLRLGKAGVERIDRELLGHVRSSWLKVARVVNSAIDAQALDPWDDGCLHLHVRRLMELVESGTLEAQGNLRRPRFSEVRLRRPEGGLTLH